MSFLSKKFLYSTIMRNNRRGYVIFSAIIMSITSAFSTSGSDDPVPNATIIMASPRTFFYKLTNALRKVRPDPKLEMQVSIGLIPLGFPSFNGVSQTRPAAICYFYGGDNSGCSETVAAMFADDTSNLSKILASSKNSAKRFGEILSVQISPNEGKCGDAKLESAAKIVKNRNCDFLKIFADSAAISDIADIFGFTDVANFAKSEVKSFAADLNPDASAIKLDCSLVFKPDGESAKYVSGMKVSNPSKDGLCLVPNDSSIVMVSRLKLSSDFFQSLPYFEASKIPQLSDYEKFAESGNGASILAAIVRNGKISTLSILPCKLEFGELATFAKKNLIYTFSVSGHSFSVKNEVRSSDGFDYLETSVSTTLSVGAFCEISYTAIVGGFLINSDNPEIFFECLKLAKSGGNKESIFGKKFARTDSDISLIVENNTLINSLFAKMGVGLSERIDDTLLCADIKGTRADIKLVLPYKAARAYLELAEIRSIAKAKKQ